MQIEWPKNGQVEDLIALYRNAVGVHTRRGEIVVRFSRNSWIEPATVCAFALEVLSLPNLRHRFDGDEDALSYLSRLDFFRTVRCDYVERFTRHPDAGRIIPLQKISTQTEVRDCVRRICDMVTRHLPNAREFVPAMEWTVNEIVDNVTIHSSTVLPGLVAAQYYPEQKRIKIGIADAGVGIRASLAKRYKFNKDFEAIEKAVERGVTRDLAIGQGNGLAGSIEIATINGGDLAIFSGDGFYRVKQTSAERGKSKARVRGTIVSMNLDTDRPVDLMRTFMGAAATGWSYFDEEVHRLQEGSGLLILSEVVHTRGREPAKALRNKIRSLVDSIDGGLKLKLDFSGIESASSSFLDDSLLVWLRSYPRRSLRQRSK